MKKIYIIASLLALVIIMGCGDVAVDMNQDTYNPKIVVEGYLYPGQSPANIRLTRNYALNQQIDINDYVITDAQVTITDVADGATYDIAYNNEQTAYEYTGSDFIVDYGKSYRIDMQATVDGKALTASAVTTTPEQGFAILEDQSKLGQLHYEEALDNDENFNIKFLRSPSIDSYITSIVAVDASLENFIEENVFGIDKEDIDEPGDSDELKGYNYLKNQSQWAMTEMGESSIPFSMDIEWFTTWFYGNYRVILYCADRNMTEYYLTHNQIQEMDGNLLEPKFHFDGDAIGVFGSAVTDTVYFEVLR